MYHPEMKYNHVVHVKDHPEKDHQVQVQVLLLLRRYTHTHTHTHTHDTKMMMFGVQFSVCLAPTSVQGSTKRCTAVANVHVSMDEKVSIDLHGTTAASLSVAIDEAQFCAKLDDAVLLKMDAGAVQRLAHGDHREVSVEFHGFAEVKRCLQQQRRTSEGRGIVSSGSSGKVVWMALKLWKIGGRREIDICIYIHKIRTCETCDWYSYRDGYEQSEDFCQTSLKSSP